MHANHIMLTNCFRSWSDEKEDGLIDDLSFCLGTQKVDMDKLGHMMRSKDHYGNDQISGQQIGACLRVEQIILDKGVMGRWMKAADIVGKGIYSIPVLLEIMEKATEREKKTNIYPGNDQQVGRMEEDEDEDDSNTTWKNLLDLNSSLPKQKMKDTMVDTNMKQKHVNRLKAAMYQSYNQSHGFLPPKEVVQLSLAYSTVFHLGLDQAGIKEAIFVSRGQRGEGVRVNIDTFINTILDYVL